MQNLSRASITSLEELEQFAFDKNIPIEKSCPDNIKSISFKFSNGKKVIAIREKYKKEQETDLELLAHELGHCETDSFYLPYSPIDLRGKHEYSANWWAIQRIIPFERLCEVIKIEHKELWELAEFFNVSEAFILKAIEIYKCKGKDINDYI